MVNSQHSTKGKMHKWRERGFHGMTEQHLLLRVVGIGHRQAPALVLACVRRSDASP